MKKPGFQSSLRDTDTPERDIWINEPPNAGQWRHQSFALIHEKVKHDFQLANKGISSGKMHMVQNCFLL